MTERTAPVVVNAPVHDMDELVARSRPHTEQPSEEANPVADDTKSTTDTTAGDDIPADDGSGIEETTSSPTGVTGSVISPAESVLNDPSVPRIPGTSATRDDVR